MTVFAIDKKTNAVYRFSSVDAVYPWLEVIEEKGENVKGNTSGKNKKSKPAKNK